MKIKKLKNKYKIEFDNREPIITYDDIILKYNILYKKELSEELIDKILKENGLSLQVRAETLSLEMFIKIANGMDIW